MFGKAQFVRTSVLQCLGRPGSCVPLFLQCLGQHQQSIAKPSIAKHSKEKQILALQGIAKLNKAEHSKAKRNHKEAKHYKA
jgi:hypothetical protein